MKTASLFFTFVASVFAAVVPSSFSADQQYEDCGLPMRCGLLSDVDYPFWGVNKPDYCGLRGFQLFCKNETYLTLKLNNLSLRVMSFDLINNTIVVADESLFLGGCPDLSLNFSGSNQFKIHPQARKIGLFKCPASPLIVEPSSFTCEGSNMSTVTYYTFPPSDILGGRDRENCTKVGDVPGLIYIYEDYPLGKTLQEALEDGFSLSYSIRENESCRLCLNSGGICGSVPDSESFRCFCPDRPHVSTCHNESSTNNNLNTGGGRNVRVKVIIGATVAGIVLALVITALILRKVKTCCIGEQHLEELVPLKRYSYAQIKKITNSFAREVGKGGFGIVYRGTLHDGCKVAVKILKESKGNNREDFINEVASMSRTSHVNIVTLLGFCYEGSKRAIIYEFLENGSLDKFISGKRSSDMDWSALYGIALGVARGLEYLHNGCRARIVHFDIKPQNVLLDDNLCPKVSDFGLAKLCEKKESILSLINARGTIGYIAPEVFSRMYGRVSYKSDVYSYGMLVLEMIGARNQTTTEGSASNTSEIYFPEWIYKDLEKGDNGRLTENSFTCEQEEIAKKMRLVGLWCIQSFPSDRPPMNRVVEMMEGSVDAIEMPPRSVSQFSVVSRPEASWLSEGTSSPSGV